MFSYYFLFLFSALKTSPAIHEQCKQLERAKTGDLLKAKIQQRPDRQELERRHILEHDESHVDPSDDDDDDQANRILEEETAAAESNASMDATSIITQVSRDDEQLNVYAPDRGESGDFNRGIPFSSRF